MAKSVRNLEVELTKLEDDILEDLGYREYDVRIGSYVVNPKPEVINKSASAYSSGALSAFIDSLGGHGNPVGFFELRISRLIPEATLRAMDYWYLIRGEWTTTCLPVALAHDDSRYVVTLAAIKVDGGPLLPPPTGGSGPITFDNDSVTMDNDG